MDPVGGACDSATWCRADLLPSELAAGWLAAAGSWSWENLLLPGLEEVFPGEQLDPTAHRRLRARSAGREEPSCPARVNFIMCLDLL
ncbi:hypothetical protein O3P69_007731 [Scylla paramamosain]|uniref:Uncharacterized protein n=1 Tax=Scylla paramamosain TaxID=85552 RepID=A0AAW0UYN4_SCYPA